MIDPTPRPESSRSGGPPVGLYVIGGGLFLAVLGVIGGFIWLALLGVLAAILGGGGAFYYEHWRSAIEHERALERARLANEPLRWQAEAAAAGGFMNWVPDLLRDLLGHREADRERGWKAEQADLDRILQRDLDAALASRNYNELITRLTHELSMFQERMKFERPDAEFEVQQRMIKLKGALAQAEHINSMGEGPQKEQAWRLWRQGF